MKAWPDNYECTGQTSIFDFIQDNSEPEILLHPGEHVWKVILGDIFEYEVEDWTYLCGKNDRGYGLIDLENSTKQFHTYSRAWNSTIGSTVFKNVKDAKHKAEENLSVYEHILVKDMNIKDIVAYEVTTLTRTHTYWYGKLKNGIFYFHYGSTYDHIGNEKEIHEFERSLFSGKRYDNYKEPVKLHSYEPSLKNMYKCNNHDKWLYAEAKYGYV